MVAATDTVRDTRERGRRRMRTRTLWLRILLMGVLPLILVIAGALWYLASERYVSTDDAYGAADILKLSANVPGQVVSVAVEDNQHVTAGQVLFRLDPRPFEAAVAQAQAQLANARLQIESLQAQYRQRLAELRAAEDTASYEETEFARQQKLLASHVGSQQQLDAVRHALQQAQQNAADAQGQIASVLASLNGNPDLPIEQHPMVLQAQAALAAAELNLSYSTVRAPENGILANVSELPAGTYLTPGTPAFSLVETDHVWVEANFKETELKHMQPGDKATVSVDAYGLSLPAHVASETPATGNEFAVLPPQNATGNWVKVVQRLPVRIELDHPDPAHPVRPGMSVTVKVDTHYENPLIRRLHRIF
jgi:membrane fusion protein (multidrug efflux system)